MTKDFTENLCFTICVVLPQQNYHNDASWEMYWHLKFRGSRFIHHDIVLKHQQDHHSSEKTDHEDKVSEIYLSVIKIILAQMRWRITHGGEV